MLRSREPSWEHPSTQRYHTILGSLAAIGDTFKERRALLYPMQCLLFMWTVIVSHSSLCSWSVGQSCLEAAWSVLARALSHLCSTSWSLHALWAAAIFQ